MVKEISAGAICYKIVNNMYYFLVIKHKNGNHYSFPKGHLNKDESLFECAIREVKEETNIDIKIVNENFTTNTYLMPNGNYKEVYYFLAKALNDNIKTQDEEIINAKWLNKEETLKTLTYQNDKVMFFKYTQSLI